MKPTDVAFNFYINSNGDMTTVSDPFKLVQLILLGEEYADEDGNGDHKIMLASYASVTELCNPFRYKPDCYGHVQWDYEWQVRSPSITLEDWLVKELNRKAKTRKELAIRHQFLVFLAKKNNKPLSFFERYLWWLPF